MRFDVVKLFLLICLIVSQSAFATFQVNLIGGAPAGGTTGQVLTKQSNTTYDYIWATPSGGGGGVNWSTPVNANIVPDGDATRNIGSPTFNFLDANVQNVKSNASIHLEAPNSHILLLSTGDQIYLRPKDKVEIAAQNGTVGSIFNLYDSTQANSVGFKSPDTLAGSVLWTLPPTDGTPGQVLSTNSLGVLSWVNAGSPSNNLSFGFTATGGAITASGNGSMAHGDAQNNATIFSSGNGTSVHGLANNSGHIQSGDQGDFVFGIADGGTLGTDSGAVFVFGQANSGGIIEGDNTGSATWGIVSNNAQIASNTVGSLTFGVADGTGTFLGASGAGEGVLQHGSIVGGGLINGVGSGSSVFGRAEGTGSSISTNGQGALAHGWSSEGFAINAGGNGSYIGGIASIGPHTTTGLSSFSHGDSNVSTSSLGTTFGLWNVNNTFLTTVVGRYAKTPAAGNESAWVDTDPLFVVGNGSSDGDRKSAFTVIKNGHVEHGGNSPTLTACGTGATVVGNDVAGNVTIGAAYTGNCIVTFNSAWTNPPVCTAVDNVSGNPLTVISTTSLITIDSSGSATSINYHCVGYQ
jgi:hypothetical protein